MNGHSSSAASEAHVMKTAGHLRSETRAEPTGERQQPQQRHHGVGSTRTSTATTSSRSSLSYDDHLTTDTQV